MLKLCTIDGKPHFECETINDIPTHLLQPRIRYYIIASGFILVAGCERVNNKLIIYKKEDLDLLKVWHAFPLIRT